MRLGRHLSISNGIDKAIDEANRINANSLQIFTKSPRSWKEKIITKQEIKKTQTKLNKYDIKGFVVHSSYLVNLATPKQDLYNKSIQELKKDYHQASLLGADYYVVHPGNYLKSSNEKGLEKIIKAVIKIIDEVDNNTKLLIENTSGAGTELGSKIEELEKILEGINNYNRVGLCLDLCHLFAAGYNLTDKKGIDKLIHKVDNKIGIDNLKLIHLNDSKYGLGKNKDRHVHIGEGEIGLKCFEYIINHNRLKDKLYIIETPPFDGEDKDIKTILKLKGE